MQINMDIKRKIVITADINNLSQVGGRLAKGNIHDLLENIELFIAYYYCRIVHNLLVDVLQLIGSLPEGIFNGLLADRLSHNHESP